MKSKICGISDSKTLKYLTSHLNPPQYIGFIVNYPKSKRFVKLDKLKDLLEINKKNSEYFDAANKIRKIKRQIIKDKNELKSKNKIYIPIEVLN